MPHPEDIDLMETDPLAVRSQAYDLVLNGWELGSGSVRIHREDIQRQVFDALGITPEEAEARFGFLLGGVPLRRPPHAGFAVGIDRFVAILAGEENIREVIAYPEDPVRDRPHDRRPQGPPERSCATWACVTPAATEPGAGEREHDRHAPPRQPGGRPDLFAAGSEQAPPTGPARGADAPPDARRGRRPAPPGRTRRAPAGPRRERTGSTSAILWGPAGYGEDHVGPGGGGHAPPRLRHTVAR